MQKYYFFRTVKVDGRPRLRPLGGQTFPDGTPVNAGLNVQADSIMRGSYPIGTVFGSKSLELRNYSTSPFYSAGPIYPMDLHLSDYVVGSHVPPAQMTGAYRAFAAKVPDSGAVTIDTVRAKLRGGIVYFRRMPSEPAIYGTLNEEVLRASYPQSNPAERALWLQSINDNKEAGVWFLELTPVERPPVRSLSELQATFRIDMDYDTDY